MRKVEEITDIFTPEGIKKLKKDQILIFQGDKKTELKITKISKGRVWAREVTTYTPEEVLEISHPSILKTKKVTDNMKKTIKQVREIIKRRNANNKQ